MQDVQGKQLKIGDRVAFSVGTALYLGSIIRLRKDSCGVDVAKVRLFKPEAQRSYFNSDTRKWEVSKWRTERDVRGSYRIVLCPEVVNEDLTNAETSVE